ncbi:hypothetical protein D4R49_02220 [bacterium]|nr:MAG: hypothetical protein D4R49_02220 [bacterium]
MNESAFTPKNRQTVVNTLAIAGFIALIGGSMWLAVYSTRYVPSVVGRLGTAAVYLGSVFTPAEGPTLSVIPTASTTIPFGEEASSASTSAAETTVPQTSKSVTPTAGKQTSKIIQIGGATTTAATPAPLNGLPDLVATINSVGYLATTSAESFIATTTIIGYRPAVNFTIKNIGTNATGPWTFTANIPTASAYLFQSQPQQSLAPGDSIDYTLGFDQANKGAQTITVTADPDKTINESNDDNNTATAKVNISY